MPLGKVLLRMTQKLVGGFRQMLHQHVLQTRNEVVDENLRFLLCAQAERCLNLLNQLFHC